MTLLDNCCCCCFFFTSSLCAAWVNAQFLSFFKYIFDNNSSLTYLFWMKLHINIVVPSFIQVSQKKKKIVKRALLRLIESSWVTLSICKPHSRLLLIFYNFHLFWYSSKYLLVVVINVPGDLFLRREVQGLHFSLKIWHCDIDVNINLI